MGNYALIKDGRVVNTIAWDGETEVGFGDGVTAVMFQDGVGIEEGYSYNNGEFTAPPLTDEQKASEADFARTNNIQTRRSLIESASSAISILQDAVDLDVATEEEKNSLLLWKKYRMTLFRIDANTADTVSWPVLPG